METPPGANVPWAPWWADEPPAEPADTWCSYCEAERTHGETYCEACETYLMRRHEARERLAARWRAETEEVPF